MTTRPPPIAHALIAPLPIPASVAQHDGLRRQLALIERLLEQADPNLVSLGETVGELLVTTTDHVRQEERTLHPLYERYGGEDGATWLRESQSAHDDINRSLELLSAFNPGQGPLLAFADLDVALTKSMAFQEAGVLPFLKRIMPMEEQGKLSTALRAGKGGKGKAREKEGPSAFAPLLERLTPQARSGHA